MRKRTRRKVYALVNPIALAIDGAAITNDAALNTLRAVELSAIEAIAKGAGTENDLRVVQDMANLAEVMARDGVGPEVLTPTLDAQEHLKEAYLRWRSTRRVVATGLGLESFRELFRWHDLQRTSISRGEYERYIARTRNLLRSGKVERI